MDMCENGPDSVRTKTLSHENSQVLVLGSEWVKISDAALLIYPFYEKDIFNLFTHEQKKMITEHNWNHPSGSTQQPSAPPATILVHNTQEHSDPVLTKPVTPKYSAPASPKPRLGFHLLILTDTFLF